MGQLLTNQEVISFCKQMAMVFRSGISASEGVELMLQDSESLSDQYKNVLEKLRDYVYEIGFFSLAVKETESFPEYVESMTELGENTGNLDEVMDSLANYYEREENLLADIKNACAYPMMMMGMMLVILLVLLVKVIPIFAEVYEQMGSQMTGVARMMLLLGLGIRDHAAVLAMIAILLGIAVFALMKSEKGGNWLRQLLNQQLHGKAVFYKASVSRFAMILSMSLRSGVDYDTGFEMARKFMRQDRKLMEQMDLCQASLHEGKSLGISCQNSGIFQGLQAKYLRISEQAGKTEEALLSISQQIDEEVSVKINNFIGKLEPTLVVVLSVLVGIILLSVMMPLMGILSSIG